MLISNRTFFSWLVFFILLFFIGSVTAIHIDDMDLSTNPGDDLFQYANGNWIERNPVPADLVSYSAVSEVQQSVNDRVKAMIEEAPLLREGGDPFVRESPSFRYRVDPKTGAFVSIEDLRRHREWVDASTGYGVNQFLYVSGGNGTSLVHPGAAPAAPLQPISHTETSIEMVIDTGAFATLHLKRTGPGVPSVQTVCTIHRDGQLDICNLLEKEATTEKEAGYFAFPFKLDAPDNARTFFDLPYGIVEADREQLPGACREWYAANSFAAVCDTRVAAYVATREAPLFTVGNMNRGAWPAKLDNNRGTIFAYVFNNYWHTNYRASQGGRIPFSFSIKLTDRVFDPVVATRFGSEFLAADDAGGMICQDIPPGKTGRRTEESFLKITEGPVMLAELTQDDQGRLLARLYNPSNEAASTTLEFPKLRIKNAWKTDLFGKNEEEVKVSRNAIGVQVGARSIATLAFDAHAR